MNLSKALGNSLWILVASGVNKVSSIVLLVILTRALGAEGFGNFSYALFYVFFFSSITEFGLTPVLIRYINANGPGAGKVYGVGLVTGFVSTSFAVLLAWVSLYFMGLTADVRLLVYIASVTLFISFRDVTFRWIVEVPFRARLKMLTPALIGIGSELTGLALVVLAVYSGASVTLILFLYVVSNLPGFILLTVLSFKEIRPNLAPDGVGVCLVLKEALPIAASNIMITVYLTFGALVLFHYVGAVELAYYALAFRLTTSLRILPEAMMHSMLPLMATAFTEAAGGMSGVQGLFSRAVKYTSLLAFPLLFGTIVVARSVAGLIGGEGFAPASVALSMLIWATFFAYFNTLFRFTFNAVALARFNFRVYSLITISTIVLSVLLIPAYGLPGACAGLLLSEAFGLIISVVIGKRVGLGMPTGLMIRAGIAALCMALVISLLPNLLLQFIVGIIAYTLFALLFGAVRAQELRGWLGLG